VYVTVLLLRFIHKCLAGFEKACIMIEHQKNFIKGAKMRRGSIAGGVCLLLSAWVWAGGGVTPAEHKTVPCHPPKVYVDSDAKLMWQDEAYSPREEGAYARNGIYGKVGTHGYAVRYCQNLNYAGYNDWRLPTADELATVHRIPGQVFDYFMDGDFWTATPTVKGKYYVIYTADAYRYKRSPRKSYYIRCVRCTEPK